MRPWVLGYNKHVYNEHPWHYLDLDLARRRRRAALKRLRRAPRGAAVRPALRRRTRRARCTHTVAARATPRAVADCRNRTLRRRDSRSGARPNARRHCGAAAAA